MADGGTLLSELDNGPPVSDGDLVNSIYADLNTPSQGNPVMNGRPAQHTPMQNHQGLGSTLPNAADPHVPTAHMIGREHPTQADFDRMVGQGPMPYNAGIPQMQQAPANGPMPPMAGVVPVQNVVQETSNDFKSGWILELKQPLLVAIIVFIMTLPAVHLLMGHYAPKLLSPGGTFTTLGLLVRALLGGALFWGLQRIVAPLLSL